MNKIKSVIKKIKKTIIEIELGKILMKIGVFFICMFAPVALIISGFNQYNKEKKSWSYPWTNGILTNVEVYDWETDDETFYCVKFKYNYSVNSVQFENNDYSPAEEFLRFNTKSVAEKEASKFQKGSKITVFYNPEAPYDSYMRIEEKISDYCKGFFWGGSAVFIFCLIVYIFVYFFSLND
jgi:hypothetical protein